MKQGNFSRSENRSTANRGGNFDMEGVESKGRASRMFSQVSENIPDMEGTLRYFGNNWKSITQAIAVLGVLGVASAFARRSGGSAKSKKASKTSSRTRH
ncbi:MAG: hypothetical protein SGI74_13640 [Oligoflexia bacterium]|nr:hypothetical protein [Oligoflexia bacterium]